MNVRDSPPEVMVSSLSPAFSMPGQVDPASAATLPLELEADELPELDVEPPELDAEPEEPCPEVDPEPGLVPGCPLDPELWPVLDPELDAVPEPPFDPLEF